MPASPNSTFDRLYRAMRLIDQANQDGPWQMLVSGTVNLGGGGGAGGTSMVDNNPFTPGGTSITPMGGYYGGRSIGSGNAAAPALNGSAVLQVDVISTSAAAGAAFATVAVYGSPAFPVYVQGTVNLAGGAAPFASVAVYGSPAMPVYVVGSVNVQGSLGVGNLGGSVGVTQIGAPWSLVGSVGVTPLAAFTVNLGNIPTVNLGLGTANIGNWAQMGVMPITGSVSIQGSVNLGAGGIVGIFGSTSGVASVNLGGVGVVDTRGSLVPTQWIISSAASGQFVMAGSAPASQRVYISSFHMVANGTLDMQWQSPSGVAISGSMRLLPGAGFAQAGALLNGPVLLGSLNSAIYILTAGTQNYGGVAVGWVGA